MNYFDDKSIYSINTKPEIHAQCLCVVLKIFYFFSILTIKYSLHLYQSAEKIDEYISKKIKFNTYFEI